jgi:hypothetical protein
MNFTLPPHDAAVAERRKPWLFDRSAKWKKAMDGFFHLKFSTAALSSR